MKRKPIFERLDLVVNPAVNLAAIKSYDEILRETLNILKEYDDVVERIWDGDLFFMNFDIKETTPLIKVQKFLTKSQKMAKNNYF
jgi:hypothetical protein